MTENVHVCVDGVLQYTHTMTKGVFTESTYKLAII